MTSQTLDRAPQSFDTLISVLLWVLGLAAGVALKTVLPPQWPPPVRARLAFGSMWLALYPLARRTYFKGLPTWRYFVGLPLGLLTGFVIISLVVGPSEMVGNATLNVVLAAILLTASMVTSRFLRDVPRSVNLLWTSFAGLFLSIALWRWLAGV